MSRNSEIRLTTFSDKAGCAGKIGAQDLAQVLRYLPEMKYDANLLVGTSTYDDAGVYRLRDDLALVQTVDFFSPVVDDPYTFGQVAAANALSDVYAMGGRPLTCLNIAAFPRDKLPLTVLAQILAGGAERVQAAGAVVVGGHTIDDDVPKYGLAVTGVVHPQRILTNAGGRAGDILVLTKPLGIGVIVTAMKKTAALLPPPLVDTAVATMICLNADASEVALAYGGKAGTDVTGFGLIGHLHELAAASGVAAVVEAGAVPLIAGALELMEQGFVCGGTRANLAYATDFATVAPAVPPGLRLLLCDAMTSGGLLIAFPPENATAAVAELKARGVPGAEVGRLTSGQAGSISVA